MEPTGTGELGNVLPSPMACFCVFASVPAAPLLDDELSPYQLQPLQESSSLDARH